jgi:hypothetical protein
MASGASSNFGCSISRLASTLPNCATNSVEIRFRTQVAKHPLRGDHFNSIAKGGEQALFSNQPDFPQKHFYREEKTL